MVEEEGNGFETESEARAIPDDAAGAEEAMESVHVRTHDIIVTGVDVQESLEEAREEVADLREEVKELREEIHKLESPEGANHGDSDGGDSAQDDGFPTEPVG